MSQLKKHVTVKKAIEYVSKHPQWSQEPAGECPIWEHVTRQLFEHANNPDTRVVGSIGRATRAQKIILNRHTGTRRAGTHPAQKVDKKIHMRDLTGGSNDE